MVKKGTQTLILIFSKENLVAVLISVESSSRNINSDVYCISSSSSKVCQSCLSKSNNLKFLTSSSPILNYILKLNGGSDDSDKLNKKQEKLVKSAVTKAHDSNYTEISSNKFLKKILKLTDPVISDQRFWRILAEFEKPNNFTIIQPTNSNRPKGLEKVTDDFESRVAKQKVLNERDSKLSQLHAQHKKRVNRFNKIAHFLNPLLDPRPSRDVNLSKSDLPRKKTASVIKQEKIGSNVNSLGRSEWRSLLFGASASPSSSSSESNISPTPALFSANYVTGDIQNINIAFNQFKKRMTQIGNQYTGEKQNYFFEQLNQCGIDRCYAQTKTLINLWMV
jgi:hypothetical protein